MANVDGDVGVLREIAGLFVQDCSSRLAALRHALASRDRVALERLAHMLKGSAGYMCAERMFAAAAELEAIARSGDIQAVERACANVRKAVAALVRALLKLC